MQKMKRMLAIVVTVCMLVSILSTGVLAVSISQKPANGTTQDQPFATGTGGSTNFRIPGIVTLDNGTLVAACDARWNHTGDGAGLDTIVSVSTDNGENWTYTFANYFGDNGNTYNNLSTCIIDPGIGTDGEKAYLIADLWPAGIALNTSKYGPVVGKTGYTADGDLMLRDLAGDTVSIGGSGYNTMAANREYNYYLDLETLELCNADGSKIEGYTVDAYFNIVSYDGSVNTNLFFSDSPYQPYPTDYLYMTTSEDGLNWSVPTLLNLKEASEQTLLVGPGNGTYDAASGRMIFTAYEHTSGYERTSLIWMDAEGNWKRSEDCTVGNWSSEASAVVLDDGTVRVFYRDGFRVVRYTDMVWSEAAQNYVRDTAATEVNTTAEKDTGCQLTAIKYSEQIGGKDAIFLATPAGSSRRTDGRIYVFLVNEDKSLDLAYAYDITPGQNEAYAYSCLTELNNGDLALLWEGDNPETSGNAEIIFSVIPFDSIVNRENDPSLSFEKFELLTGDSKTFTDTSGCYVDADISELDTSVAELTMTGEEITTNAAQILSSGANIDLDSCQYTFTATADGYYEISAATADGTVVYLNHFSTTNNNVPNITSPAGKIAVMQGTVTDMFKLQAQIIPGNTGNARTLHFHAESANPYWNRCGTDSSYKCQEYLYRKAEANETASTEIPGYVRLTSVDQVVDGGKYLIAAKNDAGNWFVLNPAASTVALDHVARIMGSTTVGRTELTFTGVGPGYTEVQVGSTVYQVTVANLTEVPVEIPVGTSVTVTESNGNYADADTSALDTSVATVTVSGTNGTTANGLSTTPVTELADGSYVIFNTRAAKAVTNAPATAAAAAGAGSGLNLSGSTSSFDPAISVWTITKVQGGYTLQEAGGQYMTIGSTTAGLTATPATLALNYNGSTWTIAKDGAYLNHFGGGSSTCAAGWQDGSAAGDAGSQFAIYAYSEQSFGPSTELTFTGVYPGTTELLVGRTKFLVNVTGEIHDVALNVGESQTFPIAEPTFAVEPDDQIVSVTFGEIRNAQLGSSAAYDGDIVALADCLYTFTKDENDRWSVSAKDGTVYLYPGNTTSSGYPNRTTAYANLSIMTGFEAGTFYIMSNDCDNSNQNTSYLYFDRANLRWDRVSAPGSNTAWQTNCSMMLYKPVEGAGSDEIPGYQRITDLADVVDGSYLIVAPGSGSNLYALYPNTSTANRYCQIAKLDTGNNVTITGLAAGETSMTLPGHIFNITVTDTVHVHTPGQAVRENEIAPTCTAEGSYDSVVYCTECGDELSREAVTVDALGHGATEVRNAAAPDCTTEGYTGDTYCTVCSEKLAAGEVIPALGHDFQNGVCTRCGLGDLPFTDVPADQYYAKSVQWAYENRITAGVTDTLFDPTGLTTRAQIVTFLWRAKGCPAPTITECPFVDISEARYYYEAVLWAYENGITAGISSTHFAPDQTCTRGQIVTFLWRCADKPDAGIEVNPFEDVSEDRFYYDAVLWAYGSGITSGIDATHFAPEKSCTRADAVSFLHRLMTK